MKSWLSEPVFDTVIYILQDLGFDFFLWKESLKCIYVYISVLWSPALKEGLEVG